MEGAVSRPTQLSHDRCFHRYYEEVGQTEMLSPVVEYKYAVLYVKSREAHKKSKRRKINTKARDKLVHNCLRSVVKIATRFSRDPDTVKDLISAGNLGVFHALSKYELDKNTRFLSYATYWIQFYIRDEFDKTALVVMPKWRQKAIRRVKQVNNQYASQKGRNASDEELCDAIDLTEAQLGRLNNVMKFHFGPVTEFACRRNDVVGNESFKKTLDKETRALLLLHLKSLGPKQHFVVRAYYGMVTDPMSLHQIAKVIGVSPERVRQIKVKALGRLYKNLRKGERVDSLQEFLV